MKKAAVLAVVFVMFNCYCAKSTDQSPWNWGYRVSLDGFGESTMFDPHEYLGFHVFLDPFTHRMLKPDFSAGMLLPARPDRVKHSLFDFHVGITLCTIDEHILSGMLRRDSLLAPRISFGIIMTDFLYNSLTFSLLAEPISLYFGEKHIRILGLRGTYHPEKSVYGWGIRLFDISHFLY